MENGPSAADQQAGFLIGLAHCRERDGACACDRRTGAGLGEPDFFFGGEALRDGDPAVRGVGAAAGEDEAAGREGMACTAPAEQDPDVAAAAVDEISVAASRGLSDRPGTLAKS